MSKLLTAHSRRGLAVALALTATLLLAACGGSGKTAGSQTSANSQTSAAAEAPRQSTPKRVSHSTLLAAARIAVITISDCLREHGIKVPPQKVSGPNPVYNPAGIDTKTPQYQRAFQPCFVKALAAYKAREKKG